MLQKFKNKTPVKLVAFSTKRIGPSLLHCCYTVPRIAKISHGRVPGQSSASPSIVPARALVPFEPKTAAHLILADDAHDILSTCVGWEILSLCHHLPERDVGVRVGTVPFRQWMYRLVYREHGNKRSSPRMTNSPLTVPLAPEGHLGIDGLKRETPWNTQQGHSV